MKTRTKIRKRQQKGSGGDDIKPIKILGSGNFGEVWKAIVNCGSDYYGAPKATSEGNIISNDKCSSENGDGYALVAVKNLLLDNDETNEEFKKEADILKKLNNGEGDKQFILKFIKFTDSPKYIVCEFCNRGDLLEWVRHMRKERKEVGFKKLTQLGNLSKSIALGLNYMHNNNIIHRDIAARNILLVSSENDIVIPKIADFGLSIELEGSERTYKQVDDISLPFRWLSPKVLSDYIFSRSSDIWSYCMLLYEIYTCGSVPYGTMSSSDIARALENGYKLKINKRYQNEYTAKPIKIMDEVYSSFYREGADPESLKLARLIEIWDDETIRTLSRGAEANTGDELEYMPGFEPSVVQQTLNIKPSYEIPQYVAKGQNQPNQGYVARSEMNSRKNNTYKTMEAENDPYRTREQLKENSSSIYRAIEHTTDETPPTPLTSPSEDEKNMYSIFVDSQKVTPENNSNSSSGSDDNNTNDMYSSVVNLGQGTNESSNTEELEFYSSLIPDQNMATEVEYFIREENTIQVFTVPERIFMPFTGIQKIMEDVRERQSYAEDRHIKRIRGLIKKFSIKPKIEFKISDDVKARTHYSRWDHYQRMEEAQMKRESQLEPRGLLSHQGPLKPVSKKTKKTTMASGNKHSDRMRLAQQNTGSIRRRKYKKNESRTATAGAKNLARKKGANKPTKPYSEQRGGSKKKDKNKPRRGRSTSKKEKKKRYTKKIYSPGWMIFKPHLRKKYKNKSKKMN